ncbi:hypothetical protein BDF19DRAFT_429869 [Syncephalis fuscata]|nr:hypothetical protein BDF19DRAFT_429869 [Syncephalis fuscata]
MSTSHHNSTANLYPMDAYEYTEALSVNLKDRQEQLRYIWAELVVHTIMSYVQVHNINTALRLVIKQPRALTRWCCLIPSVLCIGLTIFTIIFDLGKAFYMDTSVLYFGWAIPLSIMCYSIILLQKAYMLSHKSRWIFVIGITLIILQMIIPVMLLNVTVIFYHDLYRSVFFDYPKGVVLIWLCVSIAANLFLSSVFSYMAYKQYRIFGSKTWKRLASDGIQSMCLVILCNIICTVLMFFNNSRILFTLPYFIYCSVCSTILIKNCRKTRDILSETNHPKTEKMLQLSQILTPVYGETNTTTNQPTIYIV